MADSKTSEDKGREYAENIINTVREPLIVLDHDLRVISASRSFYHTFKVKPEETLGRLIYDLGNKQWDIPRLRQLLETLLPQKTTLDDYEVEHEFAGIGRRTMLFNAREIQRKSGKERLILFAIEDITERKRLANLLSESEERYRRLFETANDGILLLEKAEGKITHANPAIAEMLGYCHDELIDKSLIHIGFPDDIGAIQEILQTLESDGILHYKDTPVQTKTGQVIYTDIYMVDKARLVQCNIRDITERKQGEKNLQKIEWMLSSQQEIPLSEDHASKEPYVPPYGDLTKLNTSREILDAVGEETLKNIVYDFLDLLDTSVAVYEKNGDYALGIFSSDWCRLMDQASYRLCKTDDSSQALSCGKWLCHESCWNAAKQAIDTGKPVDVVCEGGIRLYAVPIFAGGEIIGTINIGYGDPPTEINKLSELAKKYGADVKDLTECSNAYESRPPFIIELAKRRICSASHLIGEIAERKRVEEALRHERDFTQRYLDTTQTMMVALDAEGRITMINRSGCELLGYAEDEILGCNWFETCLPHPEGMDSVYPVFRRIMAGDLASAEYFENSVVCRDGTQRLIGWYNDFLKDNDGRVIGTLGSGEDITERKQSEQEREKLQSQLLQSQKLESVGRLAGGVAHDFNNMLTIINGYAEMMTDVLSPSEPLYNNALQIHEAGKRSAVIVRKLLAFARKQTISPDVMNLNDNVASMLKMLQQLIGENIELVWRPGENLWLVKMDYSQLDQILANLVVNARDAIADIGKITIETENIEFDEQYCDSHTGFVPGQFVMLAISDTGSGMEKEVFDNLFEPFFTTKEIGKGTGLGLPTVYGIVKQNDGFVNVYSEPGEGTTFRIYLQRHAGEAAALDIESREQYPPGNGETILVLEDEVSVLNLAKTMLEKLGYKVLALNSAHEALALIKSHGGAIDLIITDVIMPEMNGRDFANRVNTLYPGIKTLFMSGYTSDVIVRHGILEEGVRYIQKPFSIQDLAIKVRKVIENE